MNIFNALKFAHSFDPAPAVVFCQVSLCLKEHGQLVHMRIRYHFIANLHITLHHKTRERRTETEKDINKPCRIEVFANQSSGYIHVTLLEH